MADDSTATTDAPGDGSSEEIVPAEPTDERREAILADLRAGLGDAVLDTHIDQIDRTQWTVVGSTLAALVVLYGFLWFIVRRAQEMLSAQQGELALRLQQLDQSNRLLARANAFLEATVEDRDRELREALAPTAEPA